MILLVKSYPYHFVRTILSVPLCPIPFWPYTILSIPFCPYHFVRYHFVLEPLHVVIRRKERYDLNYIPLRHIVWHLNTSHPTSNCMTLYSYVTPRHIILHCIAQ